MNNMLTTKYKLMDWICFINNNFNLAYRHKDIYKVNDTKHIDFTLAIRNRADFIAIFKEAQNKLASSLLNANDGFMSLTTATTDELTFSLSYNYLTDYGIEELTITIYEKEH